MAKFTRAGIDSGKLTARNWRFNPDMYITQPTKTFDDVRDDHRVRMLLRRAVNREYAPQRLIDSIRAGIRG